MKLKKLFAIIFLIQIGFCFAQQKAVLSFAEAKQLADRGDARAQAIVAMHYQLGWQTEKDESLAGRYAQASAEAGHALGIYRLGNLLVSGINGQKDPQTGYKLQTASLEGLLKMLKASTPSDPYVATALGIMLFQGKVCPQDKETALKAYHNAAAQNFAPAIFNCIMAEIEGQGIAKHPMTFFDLFAGWEFGSMGAIICECLACKLSIDALKGYPPAEKFIMDNKSKFNRLTQEAQQEFGPPNEREDYWKGKVEKETLVYVSKNEAGNVNAFENIITAKVESGEINLKIRSNYNGFTKIHDHHDDYISKLNYLTVCSKIGNTGLKETMQYVVDKKDNVVLIRPNTPLASKNRMGLKEYPIALEVFVENNSNKSINIDKFGFFIKDNKKINDFIPGLIFDDGSGYQSNASSKKHKVIFHNFGWPESNQEISANLTYWIPSTSIVEQKTLNVLESDGSKFFIEDIFNNKAILETIASHPDYAPKVLRFSALHQGNTESAFFEPNYCRNGNDFFTKINGDATLPSGRGNYRAIFSVGKIVHPKKSISFRVSLDFDQSAQVNALPFVEIDGKHHEGSICNIIYECLRHYYKPNTTFAQDGNGDAGTISAQVEYSGINSNNETYISKGEINTRPLIQSANKIAFNEWTIPGKVIYDAPSFDGKNRIILSAESINNDISGLLTIKGADHNNVILRIPWHFDMDTGVEQIDEFSFVSGHQDQWLAWYIKSGEKGRLFVAFPGENPRIYVPTDGSLKNKLSRYHNVSFSGISENDILQIGTDANRELLLIQTHKKEVISIPLNTYLCKQNQKSIESEGMGVVMIYPSDLADCSRIALMNPSYKYTGEVVFSNKNRPSIPVGSSTNRMQEIVWVSEKMIATKENGVWYLWNLYSGEISVADRDLIHQCELILKSNINPVYLEQPTFVAYIEKSDNKYTDASNGMNAVAIKINHNNKQITHPEFVPSGIKNQFAKYSEFSYKGASSPSGKRAVFGSKHGNIIYIVDLEKISQNAAVLATNAGSDIGFFCSLVRSPINSNVCSVIFKDGFYLSGDGKANGIALSDGYNAMNVSQLEVKYNRPDIVLERLGASRELIDEAKRLRNRLARRSDFKNLEGASLIDVPVVSFKGEIPSNISDKKISFNYSATNNSGNLKQLLVYNNGALVSTLPLLGPEGKPGFDSSGTVNLDLISGLNKIQLCAVNEDGVPSNFAEKSVTCTAPPFSQTAYIVSCGVSEYQDDNYNLRYAAKDAEDVANALSKSANDRGFTPKVLTFKNSEVDATVVTKIRNFLADAKVDDEVTLFFAGHGMLDKDLNYHYARHDTNFQATENIGIQFDELESLVDNIKPLKRTVLFDTCHSGEVEEESKDQVIAMVAGNSAPPPEAANVQSKTIATRGMKVSGVEPKVSRNDFLELEKLFPDSRRAKGANILTSSSGSEFSMESAEWNNGLFTYSLLKALKNPETDSNKNGDISFSEVEESVRKTVTQLSGGKQRPITRGVNREVDVVLASFNAPKVPPNNGADSNSTEPSDKKNTEKKSWWSFGS